ncbi:xylulokinase [Aestuariivirga litoralis]|uniref:xylulokinase n=1 Tax=Aestuariivirga litoralis TaxID=2650924 RepID=UPI0018C57FD0|nr:FGGY-family carbohydrate kinase [Aestuariivirga litoralis]MBG1230786.1 hypothetical protein [Aestuariivirga litoralis]
MKPAELIVAVDVGTTAIKLAVLNREFDCLAEAAVPLKLSHPQPLWAEQDPEDWWQAVAAAMKLVQKSVPSLKTKAAALVFVAQMCGVVAVDKKGKPLRPCLTWLDKRAGSMIRARMAGVPRIAGYGLFKLLRSLRLTNGAPSLNGMDPVAKMIWLQAHEPDVWAKTHKLLDVRDWVVHRATGKFITTADSANLTWMMDSRRGGAEWSPQLLKLYGVPRQMLPDIVPGSAIAGELTEIAARALGLNVGLPVVAGSGDVFAAALGSGAVDDGMLHISLGTSAWIGGFFPGRRFNVAASYATIAGAVNNRPLLIATQECAGACLDWFSKVRGRKADALGFSPRASMPMFLPWLAGERVPVDDNRLRAAFLGLSLEHDSDDMMASVAEGIALNLRWAMNSVKKQRGVVKGAALTVVGGAALNDGLCQIIADCLGQDLLRAPNPRFAGMRGAALMAAESLGWQASAFEAAKALSSKGERRFIADPAKSAYYAKRFKLFEAAYRRLAPWLRTYASQMLHD